MKNICFLIGNLNNSGGTERVTSLIANELSKSGYNISILSLNYGSEPFFLLNSTIETHSLYQRKISFKRNLLGTIFKIRSFVKRKDIDTLVVVDSISCVFTVPALYGLKINHICWEHFNFNVDLGIVYRRIGRKLAARYCDYIVTLTSRDKELWENGLENIRAKIVSIANPTPYENVKCTPSLEFKTILAMGRLTYQKGFDILIDAWSKVKIENSDWTLRIVGSGEDEIALKSKAKILKISESIDFVPVTNNVEQYYRTSSFYCLSSRFEGFGMVMVEAQSFGLPVIAFNCEAGPSDIIKNGLNGYLVEEQNSDKLAISINNACKISDENYEKLVTQSKVMSERYYIKNVLNSWTRIL